jgi:hypothetical protein
VEETKSRRGGRRTMRRWSKACNTPTGREEGERERDQESAKAFSLPDLAQNLARDLDRFGTRPKSRSSFSATFLLFKDLVGIFIQYIRPWT